MDNSDGDSLTDSMEACINDALMGYCTTLFGVDIHLGETIDEWGRWHNLKFKRRRGRNYWIRSGRIGEGIADMVVEEHTGSSKGS